MQRKFTRSAFTSLLNISMAVGGVNSSLKSMESHQAYVGSLDATRKRLLLEYRAFGPPSQKETKKHGVEPFGGSQSVGSVVCVCVCVSDSVQSQFNAVCQKECVTLQLTAELILQLLFIGFSVNKAFVDQSV